MRAHIDTLQISYFKRTIQDSNVLKINSAGVDLQGLQCTRINSASVDYRNCNVPEINPAGVDLPGY